MIVDGKAIAEDMYQALAKRRALFERPIKLGILVVGTNSVIESFVRIKTRAAERLSIEVVRVNVSDKSDGRRIQQALNRLIADTDAVIVQLPLPSGVNVQEILAGIPREKDVDALNPKVGDEERLVHAPVALAVHEILQRTGVEIAGKRAVVVGAGRLVGRPTAALLTRLSARVSMFTLEEGSIEDLKDADIVVCGAGNPGLIKPEYIKEGVALIDAGASESKGKVVGDADPACAEKAAVFTPVPGGVGPVAVAMIFKNLFDLLVNHR